MFVYRVWLHMFWTKRDVGCRLDSNNLKINALFGGDIWMCTRNVPHYVLWSAKHRHTEMLPMPSHRACPCARPWRRVIQKPGDRREMRKAQRAGNQMGISSIQQYHLNWSLLIWIWTRHSWLTTRHDHSISPSPFMGPRRRQKCQHWPQHAWCQNASSPLHFLNLHSSRPWPELPWGSMGEIAIWQPWWEAKMHDWWVQPTQNHIWVSSSCVCIP